MERAAATRCSSQIICHGKGACKGHPHPFAFVSRYTSCPEAANEFGRDWVVSIVKDVVRDMVTNGELQAVSQPTSPKSESPTLAADDLADLGGVMGMFRSKE